MSEAMRKRVVEVIPEVDDIESLEVREAVTQIWVRFWSQSGLPDVLDGPYSIAEEVDSSLVDHTRAVAQSTLAIADVLSAIHSIDLDRQTLLVLALLHDVSKLVEYDVDEAGKDWSAIGVLFPHGFMAAHEALNAGLGIEMAHLIATHTIQSKKQPESTEGTLFHYIDMACSDTLRASRGASRHLTGSPTYKTRRQG